MSPPSTPHPGLELSTPTMPSSPDTPLDTPVVATFLDAEERGLGLGNVMAKAGGRYQIALEDEVFGDKEEEEGEMALPSVETIERYMARLAVLDGSQDVLASRDEMRRMLETLLPPLQRTAPLLMLQLETQRETIANLQQSIKVGGQMARLERDRHLAEKRAWQAEKRALARRGPVSQVATHPETLAEGSMVNGKLELKVGYHQELEAANRRLEMDNRLMAPRLADTQQQIESLVNELRHLRPHVVLSDTLPCTSRSPTKQSPRHHHSMGDARTEHLLLAAHRLRKLRETDPSVGLVSMDELKAHKVVGPGGGVGYAEGYPGEDELEDDDEPAPAPVRSRQPSKAKAAKGKQRIVSNPLLPTTPRQRRKESMSTPRPPLQPTPGGGGFVDLLLAASMATRPSTPDRVRVAEPVMSATRSTSHGDGYDVESSPSKRRRVVTGPTSMTWTPGQTDDSDGGSPAEPQSALDILASASALSNTPLATSARFHGLMGSDEDDETKSISNASHHSALGPAFELRASPPSSEFRVPETPAPARRVTSTSGSSSMPTPGATPKPRAKKTPKIKIKGEPMQQPTPILTPDGTFARPAGATVPGLGKYVHLTSKMPERRERSPYLKWTVEEDELLARAVAQYGEKWDMVSKGVPTRSYHQVRQRWLRKTGAFDKKPPASSLGLQQVSAMSDETDDEDESRDVTPTPNKKKIK